MLASKPTDVNAACRQARVFAHPPEASEVHPEGGETLFPVRFAIERGDSHPVIRAKPRRQRSIEKAEAGI